VIEDPFFGRTPQKKVPKYERKKRLTKKTHEGFPKPNKDFTQGGEITFKISKATWDLWRSLKKHPLQFARPLSSSGE
jgi:hypothetical protein